MIDKSALRKSVKETLDEHEIVGRDLLDDIVDNLQHEFPDEVFDDEDQETDDENLENPGFIGG